MTSSHYDVTPDGQRFLMVKEQPSSIDGTKVVVVLNWASSLANAARAGAATARATHR